jgi:phage portal protein BeeE
MEQTPSAVVETKPEIIIPKGMPAEMLMKIQKELKARPQRGLAFQNTAKRNNQYLQKGLTKPGQISYDTLRRVAQSVHVARICINVLKEKVTKTKWVIQSTDPLKKPDDARKEKVENLLRHPNQNNETFRSLLDKMIEDLLVLDAVSIEKTRFPNGELAELFYVDSATIRPVYDEFGNQDVEIPLDTKNEGEVELPVSYVQVMDNSQYGGPESGEIVAAWPKKDMIHFHMHPQGAMESYGYGLSPLEGVVSVVAGILNADNYNSTYFENGSFPAVLIHFTGTVNERDLEAYREYFIQELTSEFHRPAITMGQQKPEVLDLKGDTNRDMQFMEYMDFLAKLLTAAYGLSPQDIGLTDDVNRATAEVQKDLSEAKGYGSILHLIKEVINNEIIHRDFGYTDLEFDWVSPDTTAPDVASTIYDRDLKNGTRTLNEVRQELGLKPFAEWADQPMILGANGYQPLMEDPDQEEASEDEVISGEKPYKEQDNEDIDGTELSKAKKETRKAVYTANYRTWADDRGYGQPFIWMDVLSGVGQVIKPPAAVNLQGQELEIQLTNQLAAEGFNVKPVGKMSYVEVMDMLRAYPPLFAEFEKYVAMTAEYDSEKWRAKFGGSRKFSYYLVSDYIDGYPLNNPLLIADMKRDPKSYRLAIHDLVELNKVEEKNKLGDRRADHFLIGKNKRAYGIDYQFAGDEDRWKKTKDSVAETLALVPELLKQYNAERNNTATKKSLVKRLLGY